ncbi:MAG: PaaI family thioesterase [Rikenellaceae bacterium]
MKFEELYKMDTFANETGVVLDELNDDHAVMHIEIKPQHLNGVKTAHGGVVYLLADITMAAMANYKQTPSVSIQSDIRFIGAAVEGDTLTAEAVEVSGSGKTLYNSRVTIKNQNGVLIAVAEGMLFTKRK